MKHLVLWNKEKTMIHRVYMGKYYRSHYNQWCCIHCILRSSTQQTPDRKLLPRSIYDVLTQISNDFQQSLNHIQCTQTLAVVARRVRCRHSVTILSRRTKATIVIRTQAFCSLSSLQRWKAHLIFTQVPLLTLSFHRCFLLLFFIRHLWPAWRGGSAAVHM